MNPHNDARSSVATRILKALSNELGIQHAPVLWSFYITQCPVSSANTLSEMVADDTECTISDARIRQAAITISSAYAFYSPDTYCTMKNATYVTEKPNAQPLAESPAPMSPAYTRICLVENLLPTYGMENAQTIVAYYADSAHESDTVLAKLAQTASDREMDAVAQRALEFYRDYNFNAHEAMCASTALKRINDTRTARINSSHNTSQAFKGKDYFVSNTYPKLNMPPNKLVGVISHEGTNFKRLYLRNGQIVWEESYPLYYPEHDKFGITCPYELGWM